MGLKVTGKIPFGRFRDRVFKSPNYKNGVFQNLTPTPMKAEGISYWKMFREFFKKHPGTVPSHIPAVKSDLFSLRDAVPSITWFGHSSYLLRANGRNFLVDPVFSGNASPFSFMVKAFPGTDQYSVDDLPAIDYLILTHDHYDHLDHKTISILGNKAGRIICSLGMASHLVYWGIREELITELDWWEQAEPEKGIEFTCCPARHFSGRSIKRFQSLWSSFVLTTATHNFFIGGDSGYDTHFKMIGDRYGPFDLTVLEAGQYNKMWPLIHMAPEETVLASLDLRAKILLPVHWGKFRLSTHPWNEPVIRIIAEVKRRPEALQVITPMIGEPVYLDGNYSGIEWWKSE
jgi:L-ascorbate metabolism protein UlaG (beta-lactamase superfamily)